MNSIEYVSRCAAGYVEVESTGDEMKMKTPAAGQESNNFLK